VHPRRTLALTLLLLAPAVARAQAEKKAASEPPPFTFGGYVEVLYSWNFNEPSNGITNYRGFDNRHNTFTLSNVAVTGQWDWKNLIGLVTLQVGHTPSTYYLAETTQPGASGANASGAEVWKYVQQAYAGYRIPVGRGLAVTAGLYLSPIGPENIPVKDNWNWSRSNPFFGLPYYHTGVRLEYPLTDEWKVTLAGYNGWNTVVDNNVEKSVSTQLLYTKPNKLVFSTLYFGGVERPTGAPEGPYWRNLFDTHATWTVNDRLSLLGHFDFGFEPNRFGTSAWVAGAASARVRIFRELLFVAARGDVFYESVASNASGTASSIFWPVPWVSSATGTFEVRPFDRASFRVEYRHDHAAGDMYFGGAVTGDGITTPYVMNRSSQSTLTVGVTTWL
jgi:hypothetical protein